MKTIRKPEFRNLKKQLEEQWNSPGVCSAIAFIQWKDTNPSNHVRWNPTGTGLWWAKSKKSTKGVAPKRKT